MSRIAYGYCPLRSALEVALGKEPVFPELQKTGDVAVGLTMLSGGGIVDYLEVPKEVSNHPDVFNLRIVKGVGDVIRRPPYGNDMLGYLGTRGPSIEAAVQRADELFQKIELRLRPQAAP